MRIQILGDSSLIVNWMIGKWKIKSSKFRTMVKKMKMEEIRRETFQFRVLLKRWIRSFTKIRLNKWSDRGGWRIFYDMWFHCEETSDVGESPQHRQSNDWCLGSQVLESTNQYQVLLKRHAMEKTKLMQENEEMKASEIGRMKNMRRQE